MLVTDILIISGIALAFVVFGVVLAWGEYQTRHLDPDRFKLETSKHDEDLRKAA